MDIIIKSRKEKIINKIRYVSKYKHKVDFGKISYINLFSFKNQVKKIKKVEFGIIEKSNKILLDEKESSLHYIVKS